MMEYPLLVIILPVIFAILIYLIRHPMATALAFVSQGAMLFVGFLYRGDFFPRGEVSFYIGTFGEGLNIAFKGDEMTYFYSLLLMMMWFSIILYSWPHRKNEPHFYFFLLFLQGVFMGILHTRDFFNLFLFIEIATILSAILIIYKKDGPSLRAGMYYLVFNTAGILLFLLGLTLLYRLTGTLNMDLAKEILEESGESRGLILIFSLMVVSMGVKSAFFPVYNWLPRAHSVATSSISAILSGVMVKSGVIGLYKILTVMPMEGYRVFFMALGLITALSGLVFGYSQWNMKRLLAFSTISHIGLILMGFATLGAGQNGGHQGALIHIANHGILKILLFLSAGMIIRGYKSYDLRRIRGICQKMPSVAFIMGFSILSIVGFPLFLGYQSKAMIGDSLREFPVFYLGYHMINLGTVMLFSKLLFIYGKDSGSVHPDEKIKTHPLEGYALWVGVGTGLLMNGIQLTAEGIGALLFSASLGIGSWITFALYISGAFILVKWLESKDLLFEKIRSFELSFQAANYMMVLFLFLMILWSRGWG